MQISLSMPPDMLNLATGHGTAGLGMVQSLQTLGHRVPYRDPACPVEINFCHPEHWEWSNPDAYHIGFMAFESTGIKTGWQRIMNSDDVDEIWTPSPLITEWMQKWTEKKMSTYLHGVDGSVWTQKKRRLDGVLRFLHPDSSANRKNAEMTVEAFKETFGDSTDVQLTLKHVGDSLIRKTGGNLKDLPGVLNLNEVVRVYKYHHVLVMPSSGEGFGIPPLEAMFTGMPVIIPGAWAPYQKHLIKELDIGSHLISSPWPVEHPGRVFEPDYENLLAAFKYAAENFSRISSLSYALSKDVREEYSWKNVTASAWKDIFTQFGDAE